MDFIIPQLTKYDDSLLNYSFDENYHSESCSIDNITNQNQIVCIIGDPGYGKTTLLEYIKKNYSNSILYKANDILNGHLTLNTEYLLIDALDEVAEDRFVHTLHCILNIAQKEPNIRIIFSCRRSYVSSFIKYFVNNNIIFIEIQSIPISTVKEFIKNILKKNSVPDQIINDLISNEKLVKLLTTPRYLRCFENYIIQHKGILDVTTISIDSLFEVLIYGNIKDEVYKEECNNENNIFLIKKLLEKIALILEIKRADKITYDELLTLLDYIHGNIPQLILSSFSINKIISRYMDRTGNIIQFNNTEIQEYLATKELCRFPNIESVFYDFAIHKDLKHVYTNWFDILAHLAYQKPKCFINILSLLINYDDSLINNVLDSLVRYIDITILDNDDKEHLFNCIISGYLKQCVYIHSHSNVKDILIECYSDNNFGILLQDYKTLNYRQLQNTIEIIRILNNSKGLTGSLINYYNGVAQYFNDDKDENIKLKIDIYNAINNLKEITALSSSFINFSRENQNYYIDITGYSYITDKSVIDIWIDCCNQSNPHAINAILHAQNMDCIEYIYNKLIDNNSIILFFNPKGNLSVSYYCLKKQLELLWDRNDNSKIIVVKIISLFIECKRYNYISEYIFPSFKSIINSKSEYAVNLLKGLKRIDIHRFINSVKTSNIDNTFIDNIQTLINENKLDNRDCAIEALYPLNINVEPKYPIDKSKPSDVNLEEQFIFIYNEFVQKDTSDDIKLEYAEKICKNIDKYNSIYEMQPLINYIEEYISKLDLEQAELIRTDRNSFSISYDIIYLHLFIKSLYKLNKIDFLSDICRITLAKSLPTIINLDKNTVQIYKSIIGNLSKEEQGILIEWWNKRNDNFFNSFPKTIMTIIKEFKFESLSFFVKEFVITNLNNNEELYTICEAIDLLNSYEIYRKEDFEYLYNKASEVKIQNIIIDILISKYQQNSYVKKRINYLKSNVIKVNPFTSGHARRMSSWEIEFQRPTLFNCFKKHMPYDWAELLIGLFNDTLKYFSIDNTKDYAHYITREICDCFVVHNYTSGFNKLRSLYNEQNDEKIRFYTLNVLNNAERQLLNKNSLSNIVNSVMLYNECINTKYLPIRNDFDFITLVLQVIDKVDSAIQNEGLYSVINNINEDLIQKTLKNNIVTQLSKIGIKDITVDREVTLYDNKRTDILIKYGICRPIMIELKLLNNPEIVNEQKRQEYKTKFIQYAKGTNACFSIFWVFDTQSTRKWDNFYKLRSEYENLNDTTVIITDCKCSSTCSKSKRKK